MQKHGKNAEKSQKHNLRKPRKRTKKTHAEKTNAKTQNQKQKRQKIKMQRQNIMQRHNAKTKMQKHEDEETLHLAFEPFLCVRAHWPKKWPLEKRKTKNVDCS